MQSISWSRRKSRTDARVEQARERVFSRLEAGRVAREGDVVVRARRGVGQDQHLLLLIGAHEREDL